MDQKKGMGSLNNRDGAKKVGGLGKERHVIGGIGMGMIGEYGWKRSAFTLTYVWLFALFVPIMKRACFAMIWRREGGEREIISCLYCKHA